MPDRVEEKGDPAPGAQRWLGTFGNRAPKVQRKLSDLRDRTKALFARIDARTGGLPSIVWTAIGGFAASYGSQAAAGLTYYAIFSLFPLLILMVWLLGWLLGQEKALAELGRLVNLFFPVAQEEIDQVLGEIVQGQGSLPIVALVSLLWAASGFFSAMARNIHTAWARVGVRRKLPSRIVGLMMVMALLVLLFLTFFVSLFLELAPRLSEFMPNLAPALDSLDRSAPSWLLRLAVTFLLLFGVYALAPGRRIWLPAPAIAAGLAALVWQGMSRGYGWFVDSGLSDYHVVYGSLGAMVALLFWLYLSGWILLFGAHLAVAIHQHHRR